MKSMSTGLHHTFTLGWFTTDCITQVRVEHCWGAPPAQEMRVSYWMAEAETTWYPYMLQRMDPGLPESLIPLGLTYGTYKWVTESMWHWSSQTIINGTSDQKQLYTHDTISHVSNTIYFAATVHVTYVAVQHNMLEYTATIKGRFSIDEHVVAGRLHMCKMSH